MKTTIPLLAAASSGSASTLTSIDWLAIALYFGILLCVAWWVVKRRKDTATDYFLAGRNLGWWIIGASIFASNIGSEHIVGLAGQGATDGVAMAHYELHAWCLLVLAWVFVPFYARSLVFTMPEFLERRFSVGSRYVLSIVSLITFVVTKIAVGIYAGGVVFATLLPEVQINLGTAHLDPSFGRSVLEMLKVYNPQTGALLINSFWIGSVAVIALTGLYTALGGMRAVAYNDAVQVTVLIGGSALLTFYGLHLLGGWTELRRLCGLEMFNLWKPITPPGVQSTWAPVLERAADGQIARQAWYFNSFYPWPGMLICAPVIGLWYWCTDQYIVQRALGAPNEQMARRGSIFASFLKLFPPYLFIIPGMICFALAKSGKVAALASHGGPGRPADSGRGPGRLPPDGQIHAASRSARHRRRRPALGPDGLAGRRVQRLLDPVHRGPLPEVEARLLAASARAHRPDRHHRHGRHRDAVDPRHPGRPRPVQLPAIRARLPGPADLRGLLLRHLLAPPQRPRLPLGHRRGLCPGPLPHAGGHARDDEAARLCRRLPAGLLPLDHQQYLLPILQCAHHGCLGRRHGRCQLPDGPAAV